MGLWQWESRGFDRAERGDGVSNIRDMGLEGFGDSGGAAAQFVERIGQSNTLDAVSKVGRIEAMDVMGLTCQRTGVSELRE